MVEDQLARFSTWATASGVFSPERLSMDHRLRNAPDVRNVVSGLLESLNYQTRICHLHPDVIFRFLTWKFQRERNS